MGSLSLYNHAAVKNTCLSDQKLRITGENIRIFAFKYSRFTKTSASDVLLLFLSVRIRTKKNYTIARLCEEIYIFIFFSEKAVHPHRLSIEHFSSITSIWCACSSHSALSLCSVMQVNTDVCSDMQSITTSTTASNIQEETEEEDTLKVKKIDLQKDKKV